MNGDKANPESGVYYAKELGRDLLGYLPAKIIPFAAGILATAIITRLVKPDAYGMLILITTTLSLISTLCFDWVGYGTWRYFEKYKNQDRLPEFLGTVINIQLIIFIFAGVIIYFASLLKSSDDYFNYLLRIGILVLISGRGITFIMSIMQLERKTVIYSLYSSLPAIINLFLIIFFLRYLAMGVEGILFASIIANGVIIIPAFIFLYKRFKISYFSLSKEIAKKAISFGLPQIGVVFGAFLLSLSDRYMIDYFSGTADVGIYNAGYKMAEFPLQFIFGFLVLGALPIIMQTFENKGEAATSQTLHTFIKVYLVILIPAALGTIAIGEDIIRIVLGTDYYSCNVVLPWVVGGVFCFGLSQYIGMPLQLKEKPVYMFILILSAGILNILMNLFMILLWGIVGAAISTFLAYFVYLLFSAWVNNKFIRVMFPWKTLIKSALAAIIMYIAIMCWTNFNLGFKALLSNLMLKILLGVVTYLSILYFCRENLLQEGLKSIIRRYQK